LYILHRRPLKSCCASYGARCKRGSASGDEVSRRFNYEEEEEPYL
jgi:hypothetical protein